MKLKPFSIKYSAAAVMLAVAGGAMAQGLNSAYYTDDYKFRHDMNPAFANSDNYVSIPALGNVNVNVHGNFGYQDVIMDNPMYPNTSDKKMTTFMNPYISVSKALEGFSKGGQPYSRRCWHNAVVRRIQRIRRLQHNRA